MENPEDVPRFLALERAARFFFFFSSPFFSQPSVIFNRLRQSLG